MVSAAGRLALLPDPIFPFEFLNRGNDLWSLAGGIPVIVFHFADLFGGRLYLLGALQIVFEQFPIDLRFIRHRDAVRQGRPATEAMSSFFESTHFEATA